VFRSFS